MLQYILLLLLFIAILIVSLYTRQQFTYWKRRGVKTLNPLTPGGDVLKSILGLRNQNVIIKDCYVTFKKKGLKYGGLYFTYGPIFFPIDVELIKRILQTDFEYFNHRGMYHNKKEQPLSEHIFALEGEEWKILRMKLTPMFSSGKLKKMYPIVLKYSDALLETVKDKQNNPIDVHDLFKRYTMDVVLNCFFGIEEDNLRKGHTIYMDMAHKISNASILDLINVALTTGTRNPGNLIKVLFKEPSIYAFFKGVVGQVIDYRTKNNIKREDFVDYLLDIFPIDKRQTSCNFDNILAQILALFTGGFETSSFTLSSCLYELANNQSIQQRLREEIWHLNNELDYNSLMGMKYLNQIIMETVRKHPVLSTLNRYCVKDYKIPNENLIIEKGTPVMISVLGFHHDPEYFPRPDVFDPDRFTDKNRIPFMIGFGAGPRQCLGKRFADLQMKLVVAKIVQNFKITLNRMTGPLELDNVTRHLLLQHKNIIWLDFEEIV